MKRPWKRSCRTNLDDYWEKSLLNSGRLLQQRVSSPLHLISFSIRTVSGTADLDPRISNMYEQVGQILSHYRSGKVPKAFKILPNLANWEQVDVVACRSTGSSHSIRSGSPDYTTRSMDCRVDVSSDAIIRLEYGRQNGSKVKEEKNKYASVVVKFILGFTI